LLPALEWQAREISRRSEMEVDVRAEMVSENLPEEVNICIYRLVQEALNNAARHASARNARVEIVEAKQALRVEISDDGGGFDSERVRGVGLLGMEERVKHLGGSLSVESQKEKGTVVRAELPLNRARPA